MKGLLGIAGLLVALAIVGVLARKQLGSMSGSQVAPPVQGQAAPATAPTGSPQQQVEQARQAVESSLQQARPMPDDTK